MKRIDTILLIFIIHDFFFFRCCCIPNCDFVKKLPNCKNSSVPDFLTQASSKLLLFKSTNSLGLFALHFNICISSFFSSSSSVVFFLQQFLALFIASPAAWRSNWIIFKCFHLNLWTSLFKFNSCNLLFLRLFLDIRWDVWIVQEISVLGFSI